MRENRAQEHKSTRAQVVHKNTNALKRLRTTCAPVHLCSCALACAPVLLCTCALAFFLLSPAFAQDLSSRQLVIKAREAQAAGEYDLVLGYTAECIDGFKQEANSEQATLAGKKQESGKEGLYQSLNDVATSYFIRGEVYLAQGKDKEAIAAFNVVINDYPSARAWDPRGWFYSLAQKSRASLIKIENKDKNRQPKETKVTKPLPPKTELKLHDPGTEEIVDYEKYGRFVGRGTKDYRYVITDQEGLSQATGEGIYPNTTSVRWNPGFNPAMKQGRLKGSHWDFVHSPDLEASFFKWATAPEPPAVRLYYTALILERGGYIRQAIKAYYAIIVHFPRGVGWTYWHTPWYVSQAAIYKIKHLLRRHPKLGMRLEGARLEIINGFDQNINNDIIIVDPGQLKKTASWWEGARKKIAALRRKSGLKQIKRSLGRGKVKLAQYRNGHWQILVEGKPYLVRGVTYSPTKVGQGPDDKTLTDWMDYDFNTNGKPDGPYDSFVDKNNNNRQDRDEPTVGDFQLMKEMGVNTLRIYHQPFPLDKELLRDLYDNYGIRVIIGDFLGKYALGSGASWYEGTDYTNPEHRKNMLASALEMVREFKDEPFVLFWLLGNENVYGLGCNADKHPGDFFRFANEAARAIKAIDPDHPVALANGDTLFLDKFAKYCPDIDIFAANAYRGDYGFVDFWQAVSNLTDKPALITEYGCPAYKQNPDGEEKGEALQAEYHRAAWQDIRDNSAGFSGYGNAIGGVIFEWLDEWWKAYEPSVHDSKRLWAGPFPDGFMYEEWLGVAGQGNGENSPFLRRLRKVYYMYKEMWK